MRARLIALVDSIFDGTIVAIAAPAGWGKSELLRSWELARRSSTATAWMSLAPGDDVPRQFWRRFLAAVGKSEWAGRHLLASLEVAPDGEVEGGEIVRTIIDRVPADADPLVVVIDDLHLLSDGQSAADLAQLMRHLPSPWRLVLSGRSLPVPLVRLRLAGLVTVIGSVELAFDEDEAATVLAEAGCRLTGAEVGDLVRSTQGWAAGLRLASLPLARGVSVVDVLQGLRSGRHDIERYFREELLGAVAPDVAEFLLDTCVASILDARLAHRLSGRADATEMLRTLHESGVFTSADRAQSGSYRYHPLLAESLEQHLLNFDPLRRGRLHRVAAEWYREQRILGAAFTHAIRGEDWAMSVELLDDLWMPLFVNGEIAELNALLASVPPGVAEGDVGLRALRELVALERADDVRADRFVNVDVSSTGPELVLAMEVARRAGQLDVVRRVASVISCKSQTGERVGSPLRAYVLLSLGVAEYWANERVASERDLRCALAQAEEDGLDYLRLGCLSQLVGVLTAQNRVNDAEALAHTAVQLAADRGWEGSGWASELWHALGWISYLRADVDAAAAHLERAERSVWHHDAVVGAIIPTITALVERLRGRSALAKALLDLADSRLPIDRERYVFLDYIDAEKVRHAVDAGELRHARERLSDGRSARSLHHCVAKAELLVAEGRTDDARSELRRGLDEAEGWLDQRLHVMVLLASLDTPDAARAVLLDAMRMAAPERIIQPFCQVGQPVMAMVADLASAHRALRPFAKEIRARYAMLPKFAHAGSVALPIGTKHLTPRELEVLQLLEGHDSLTDIAARLHVSINTLKVHTRHLYEKLGVRSRRDALVEAAQRNLL